MRTEPNTTSLTEKARKKERADKVTRIVALVLAGATVFSFFFKLLFF